MKKVFLLLLTVVLFVSGFNVALAGDCKTRDQVDQQATITTAVFLRSNCPEGDIVGTIPGGEVVEILEVDRFNEFYLVKSSVGTGFLFNSFLKDIKPLDKPEAPPNYKNSVFKDLDPNHKYYDSIAALKEQGIISGNPQGEVLPDNPINRAELAKILVEATSDDETISSANLQSGIYSDVDINAWYSSYLAIAREKSILTGDGDKNVGLTTVRPGDNANGAEVAKMIVEAFELSGELNRSSSDNWYSAYLELLKNKNALPYSNADHIVSRAEMMFMVDQVISL